MGLRYYANAPATTLSASCTNSATTIQVTATTGLPISYPYTLIIDRGLATEEVVSVTNAAGTTLTVTRGYDSTTAFAHANGAAVAHGISAIEPREANAHVNATTGVHGVSGSVVGTTDTQTMTNKTLTAPKVNQVNDVTNNKSVMLYTANVNAINQFTVNGSQGAVAPSIAATGTDTNINVELTPKGTGRVTASGVNVPTISSTDTLTNKTLTTPKIDQINNSANNSPSTTHESVASGVNYVRHIGSATGNTVAVGAGGTDANVGLDLFSKGTGVVTVNGVQAVTTTGTQTLTNKTLSTGTIVGAGTDISGAWTAYSPTLSGWTLGNGTLTGKYVQIGKTVTAKVAYTVGSTDTIAAANPGFSFPVVPAAFDLTNRQPMGFSTLFDTSASAFRHYPAAAFSGSQINIYNPDGTPLSNTVPWTWATGDKIVLTVTYEAA